MTNFYPDICGYAALQPFVTPSMLQQRYRIPYSRAMAALERMESENKTVRIEIEKFNSFKWRWIKQPPTELSVTVLPGKIAFGTNHPCKITLARLGHASLLQAIAPGDTFNLLLDPLSVADARFANHYNFGGQHEQPLCRCGDPACELCRTFVRYTAGPVGAAACTLSPGAPIGIYWPHSHCGLHREGCLTALRAKQAQTTAARTLSVSGWPACNYMMHEMARKTQALSVL